jgi:hypothetical protein
MALMLRKLFHIDMATDFKESKKTRFVNKMTNIFSLNRDSINYNF